VFDDGPLAVHVDPEFHILRRLHRAKVSPTIGQAVRAVSGLIIVPSQGNPAMGQAYERLASQWVVDRKYSVVKDDQSAAALPRSTTVWIFGTAAMGRQPAAWYGNDGEPLKHRRHDLRPDLAKPSPCLCPPRQPGPHRQLAHLLAS
jgi:hypothetical protein